MGNPPTHRSTPDAPCAIALGAAVVLILPWAAAQRGLGASGFLAILAFAGFVGLGALHALRRGGPCGRGGNGDA